jgi:hypothetical protein
MVHFVLLAIYVPIACHLLSLIATGSRPSYVRVVTSTGEYRSRFCVVTASIGVLKQSILKQSSHPSREPHSSLSSHQASPVDVIDRDRIGEPPCYPLFEPLQFDPPLSQSKYDSITNTFFNNGIKLVYVFDQPFWDQKKSSSSPSLTYMCHNGLSSDAVRWWPQSYGRHDLGNGDGHVIASYITGERASRIDALSETDALHEGLKQLSQLLDIPFETLNSHCQWRARVSWSSNPWVRGAYAAVPVGNAANIRQSLSSSEYNNHLHFAGEATAIGSNPQTVHGAFDSGYRVANTISKLSLTDPLTSTARIGSKL